MNPDINQIQNDIQPGRAAPDRPYTAQCPPEGYGYHPGYYMQQPVGPSRADQIYRFLRKHAISVGIAFIVYFILQEAIAFLLHGVGLYEVYDSNTAFQNLFNGLVFSVFAMGVPFLICGLTAEGDRSLKNLPLQFPQGKLKTASLIFAGLAICVLANYAALFAGTFLENIGIHEVEIDENISETYFDAFTNILGTAFVPALVEEFVFRGVIMQPLLKGGRHFAVISTAVVFAFAHARPTSIVFAFIVGLAIGYAVVLSGSMWTGIIIHFVNNLYACVVGDVFGNFPDLSETPYILFQAVLVVLGLSGAVYLAATRSISLEKERVDIGVGRSIRAFWLAVPMILTVIGFLFYVTLAVKL